MLLNLKEVFENRLFRIPGYQRGYSWEEKHLVQLWNDLKNIGYPFPIDSNHFTGTLTLNNFSENDLEKLAKENHGYTLQNKKVLINDVEYSPFHLVDGQQRMTTLLILVSILIDAINDDPDCTDEIRKDLNLAKSNYLMLKDQDDNTKHLFGYEKDVPSHEYLLNEIFHDKTINLNEPKTLYTNRLQDAFAFFSRKLKDEKFEDNLKLKNKIVERLLFSILILNEKNDKKIDVSMAFETLNFRGKDLSNLELFKNRVLFLISKTRFTNETKTALKEKVINSWLNIYKWLGRNKDKELNDDDFLKAFWLLYFSNSNMVSSDFKEWKNDIFDNKFSLDENPNVNNLISQNGLPYWLNVMDKSIEIWFIIKNPLFFKTENSSSFLFSDEILEKLYQINAIPQNYGNYTQHLILSFLYKHLPSITDEFTNEELESAFSIINNFLTNLERHNFVCFILNGNKGNYNLEKIYRCVNHYFRTGQGVILYNDNTQNINLTQYIANDLTSNVSIENIKRNFHSEYNKILGWNGLLYYLINWEIFLAKENENSDLSFEKLINERLYVSTIFPEDPILRKNFEELSKPINITRDKYCYSLGNIFLSRVNSKHTTFQHLKDKISNNNNSTFIEKDLLNYDNNWNQEKILERGKIMFTFLMNNWSLNFVNDLTNPTQYSNAKWNELLLDI